MTARSVITLPPDIHFPNTCFENRDQWSGKSPAEALKGLESHALIFGFGAPGDIFSCREVSPGSRPISGRQMRADIGIPDLSPPQLLICMSLWCCGAVLGPWKCAVGVSLSLSWRWTGRRGRQMPRAHHRSLMHEGDGDDQYPVPLAERSEPLERAEDCTRRTARFTLRRQHANK
ncbi:hypothetical protein WMY93_020663 [Mugilogobius chulae]|uniref:Uncharacterized protein n=1 Tax=Mugilogobius chulae TaxID=88201 RepID=A0AAW0NKR4_9GOBI